MKTKWHLYMLWSVLSLSIGNYVSGKHESPSTRRPSRRKGTFKLNSPETATNPDPGYTLGIHGDATPSVPQLDPRLQLISTLRGPESHGPRSQPSFAYLPDVSVTCSTSDFVVRVKPAFYGLGANADELRLGGTCTSNGVLRPPGDLLFNFPVTECDVQREMHPDYIAYKYVLAYTPSPNRSKGGGHSFAVNIECRYPRMRIPLAYWFPTLGPFPHFGSLAIHMGSQETADIRYHHVYQLAVRPTWQTAIVRKNLRGRPNEFQIQLMDDAWKLPAQSQTYDLGQTVNLQVSALRPPPGGKVYIRSCFATPYDGSASPLKYSLIDNSGCMSASQEDPVGSGFVPSQDDQTVRFSLSAFQFTSHPDTQVQIQCDLHVSSEGPSAVYKACTYKDKRWRALSGDDYICDCCESQCMTSKSKRAMLEGSANSDPILVSDQPPTSEDHPPSATPPQISTTVEGEPGDILALTTKTNRPITERSSPRSPANTSHSSKTSGEEEGQQSAVDSEEEDEVEEVEEELEGGATVWVDGAKAIGRLNKPGFGSGLITKEWEGEMSGMGGDWDEFREDGDPRETEENDELGPAESWGTKDSAQNDEPRGFSGGTPGRSLVERLVRGEEAESQVTVAQRKTTASGMKGIGRTEQPHEEEEEEEKREVRGGRGEEVERPQSDAEWEDDKSALGGLVKDVVNDKETTWYFTWR